jgi:hypothetical protein
MSIMRLCFEHDRKERCIGWAMKVSKDGIPVGWQ